MSARPASWMAVVLTLLGAPTACQAPRIERNRGQAPGRLIRLGEPFAIGRATCRVADARTYLTVERPDPAEAQRVLEDVHVLAVRLQCEDAAGRDLSAADALPQDTLVLLTAPTGPARAPSARTFLSDEAPDLLVFEVPAAETHVGRPRRYATQDGRRLSAPESSFETLQVRAGPASVDVVLHPRAQTQAFERALDEFMHTWLAPDADGPAEALRRALRDQTRAPKVTVSAHPSAAEPWPLELEYAPGPGPMPPRPVTLTLRMAPLARDGAPLALLSIEDRPGLERTLQCAEERAVLRARAARAYADATPGPSACHVLGLPFPFACSDVPGALLGAALAMVDRCVEPDSLRERRAPVPPDFQLTLRRGRTGSPLDRKPRYTLSLFAGGSVVFHGQHWVSQVGRSDGRTTERVLEGLYAHLLALGWFERRGGAWSAEGCSTDDETGHLIALRAAGRERAILDREGCRGPFTEPELAGILALVEAGVGIDSYTQGHLDYQGRRDQVWTIE